MTTYGRNVIAETGIPVRVSADGQPEYKPGGVTIDWTTVTAATSDTELADGTVIPSGQRGLRYGQVLCEITSGGSDGMFGPYDSGASDGRQTLTRGSCYILDETVLERGQLGLTTTATSHPAVLEGGLVWKARLLVGTTGHPSLNAFETAFPRIRYAQ